MKIAILGTDNVAVRICEKIAFSENHELICVGYHHSMEKRAEVLSKWASDNKIKLINDINKIPSEVNVVLLISYPGIIKGSHLDKFLFLNIHNSLLPKYRGLHAMVWALLNDEKIIGYSIHKVEKNLDGGEIYYQDYKVVNETDDILTLQEWQFNSMVNIFPKILDDLSNGLEGTKQIETDATYVTKRSKIDGRIDWTWPARRIFNLIRAIKPPYTYGAYTYYKDEEIIITKSHILPNPEYFMETGKIVAVKGESAYVKCGDSILCIDEVLYKGEIKPASEILKQVGIKLF